jgi:hypothetical protein
MAFEVQDLLIHVMPAQVDGPRGECTDCSNCTGCSGCSGCSSCSKCSDCSVCSAKSQTTQCNCSSCSPVWSKPCRPPSNYQEEEPGQEPAELAQLREQLSRVLAQSAG